MSDHEPSGVKFNRADGSGKPTVREMPLFPLNTVLFPGMPLPLQIFEPRYHTMVRRCLESDRTFGVALILEGEEVGGIAQVWPVGTCAHIERLERLPDGRLALATKGMQRFRIVRRLSDNPYPRAMVEMLDEYADMYVENALLEEARDLLHRYLQGWARSNGQEWEDLDLPEDGIVLGYIAGAVLPCSMEEKQRILQTETPEERLNYALPMLRLEVARLEKGMREGKVARPYEPEIRLSAN